MIQRSSIGTATCGKTTLTWHVAGAWIRQVKCADASSFASFQRGVTVADMLREMPEHAVPEHGAAS